MVQVSTLIGLSKVEITVDLFRSTSQIVSFRPMQGMTEVPGTSLVRRPLYSVRLMNELYLLCCRHSLSLRTVAHL